MKKPDPAIRFRRPIGEPQAAAQARASAPRWLRLLAAGLGALVLVWLVIRVSVAGALLAGDAAAAAWLSPQHPEVLLAGAGNGPQPVGFAQWEEAAIGTLSGAPLADEPLLLAARQAIRDGDTRRGDRLLAEVIHRDPRSRYALMLQLDRQVQQDRLEDAASTVAVLIRLLPESGALLTDELARMAGDPGVRAAIARIVETDEAMRKTLLEALVRQQADLETIFSLAGPLRPTSAAEAPRWQPLLLNDLVARGQVTQARRAWSRMAGTQPARDGIYDADFAGLPGPAPFNWRFNASREGFAEFSRGSAGLYVEYYGRRDATIGGQLLTLAPGRYRIAFQAEGSADGEGGRLAWTVTCQANDQTLTAVPIAGVDFTPKAFSTAFAVPAGCPAQWLRLTGKFGEFPRDQRITISGFRIEQAAQS